jgi:hypothetical protein
MGENESHARDNVPFLFTSSSVFFGQISPIAPGGLHQASHGGDRL